MILFYFRFSISSKTEKLGLKDCIRDTRFNTVLGMINFKLISTHNDIHEKLVANLCKNGGELYCLDHTLDDFHTIWFNNTKVIINWKIVSSRQIFKSILLRFKNWNILCLPRSFRRLLQHFWDHRSKLNPKFLPRSHGMWTYMLSRMHHSSPLKCEIINQ